MPVGLGGGMPAVRSPRRYRAVRRPREPDVECTLLVRGKSDSLYSLKFTEKQVRYTYLGSRLKPSSAQNLALFLTDLMRHCPHAFFPASTRAAAAGNKLRVPRLKAEPDYERFLKWVLCCIARGPGQQQAR